MKRKSVAEDASTYPSTSSANGDRSGKRIKSEERRLQSLLEKRELERRRQCVVSETLKKVDLTEGTGLNKKIRFDSDDDDDDNPPAPTSATAGKDASTNGATRDAAKASSSASGSKKERPALFDDDGDEDDVEDGDQAFALKPHFFGKKGAELMALESRYGGDDRFKLSDKFLDEEEEQVAVTPL